MRASHTDTGRWIRQGRNVIVLLDTSQRLPREPSFAAEMAAWEHETEVPGTTRWVQDSLNRIMGAGLAVDGIAGPQTRAAIMDFQRREGLAADGIVGPLTTAALQAALAKQAPGGYAPGAPAVPGTPAGGDWRPARWTLGPNANSPGVPLTPTLIAFVDRMAAFYPGRLVLSTGTKHAKFVKGTNKVSDHYSGNAADFGMRANNGTNNGPVGDQIAIAALMAAGRSREEATRFAQRGGKVDIPVPGVGRVQVIWKYIPGTPGHVRDHHHHVHVGIRP